MEKVLVAIAITICGMWGGQQQKWVRRYLLPSIATTYTSLKDKYKKKWKAVFYLLLMGILSIGYGENSILQKLFKGCDWLTRFIIGLLVALPFLVFGKWYALIILPLVRLVKAGGFKISKDKDFLWEDFIFYGSIGILVVI